MNTKPAMPTKSVAAFTTDKQELVRLVAEMNATELVRPVETSRLDGWLSILREREASDLYLVTGVPPAIKVHGKLTRLPELPLAPNEIEEAVLPALPSFAAARYRTFGVVDASLRRSSIGRFRVNVHRERGRPAATIRALPLLPPELGQLGLPPGIEALAQVPHGLVLIGGPTGSGKTTTLAALVDVITRRDAKHIVTIEDPIEYEYPHRHSVVEQIEVGIDVPDFATALRAAVRQSPDVIVIGEMRDPETMKSALAAAETGHLVLSTLHTTDVAAAVARISDSFPPERQPTIRQDLSMALAAVMTQVLLPKTGGGRIPAAELLMVGYGARQHVRKNALQHLHQEITMTRREGSFTFEECLAQLTRNGLIDREEARARARHREELDGLLAH
ncbi:MAG TPA: PilT/PilU family type 4a pilus ATPase [Vicinamibacterales bacterium]|jgi:twitching motility protein PilT|nr:PilT/PilU family type 4a pilus ATPase [Vicinamibacterales bacterium]